MKTNTQKNVLKLAQMGMLIAISIVLVLLIRFPIFPAASFLVYDMADIPVLIGGLLFGPVSGLVILAVESFLQAFLLGGDGLVGFLMHFLASGVLILVASLFYKKWKTYKALVVGMVLGCLGWMLAMIPLNYIFTVHVYGVPLQAVNDLMLPCILPFNLIKSGANSFITLLVFFPLSKFLKREKQI